MPKSNRMQPYTPLPWQAALCANPATPHYHLASHGQPSPEGEHQSPGQIDQMADAAYVVIAVNAFGPLWEALSATASVADMLTAGVSPAPMAIRRLKLLAVAAIEAVDRAAKDWCEQ